MKAIDLLHISGLKSTPCRLQMLELLIKSEHALAHADIERYVDPAIDRVTIYRTLKTFIDQGLVHRILDDAGQTKYALCNECSKEGHDHEHVHFKCKRCGQTLCLEEIRIPEVKLPNAFRSTEKNLLIKGICNQCN